MNIDLTSLNLINHLTDGEEWLCRVADALEAGEMPSSDDIERMVDAVALLRLQAKDKESPEQRRADLLRKLRFMKNSNREADKHDFKGREIAFNFWAEVILNDSGVNKTLKRIAEEYGVSERNVRDKKDAYLEQGRYALSLFRGVVPEDSKAWTDAVKLYRKTCSRLKK